MNELQKLAAAALRAKWEEMLAHHIKVYGLPEPSRQYKFAEGRKFAFDFAWPDRMIAAECEGGIWMGNGKGAHSTGTAIERDCVKYNLATALGWRLFRFTGNLIKSGAAAALLSEMLTRTRGKD